MIKYVLSILLIVAVPSVYATGEVAVSTSGNLSSGASSIGTRYDEEFLQALHWMHEFGLTRYEQPDDFRPYDILTRQEAAKFFAQFASEVLYRTLDQTRYCVFDDMDEVDPTLKNYIIQACMLRMFSGSGGHFFPFATFTKGQALAVLMRGLIGYEDEGGRYRREVYRQKARDLGLTKDTNIAHGGRPATRYEVALLLWRAAQKIE